MHDFASLLRHAEGLLPPALISAASAAHARRVAALLPANAIDFFGFEARLGPELEPADCAFNLTPDGARLVAAEPAAHGLPSLSGNAWRKIRHFYREWANTRDLPFTDAGSTWLEFDARSVTDAPEPNLLFGYWPENSTSRRPLQWLTDLALPLLRGESLPERFKSNLERCFDAPAGARDFQIGVMLARDVPAVRVCVFDVAPSRIAEYLQAVAWPGPRSTAAEYTEMLAGHADFLGLHLDVGEVNFPTLGIEPGFTAGPWARQPHLEPRWHEQLDELVRCGLCTEAKRQALLGWVGYQPCPEPELAGYVLLRGLSHVKIAIGLDGRPAAKAYFGVALRGPKACSSPVASELEP